MRFPPVLPLVAALLVVAPPARSQSPEMEDAGVAATAELRSQDLSAPTPVTIPGARIIFTGELLRLAQLAPHERPVLFDVLGADNPHDTLPGAIWLPGAGRGTRFDDEVQERLAKLLSLVLRDNPGRPVVFFCSSPRCWLSYNAALRAARLGYPNVRWYRGGIEAWIASGGEVAPPRARWQGS